MKVDIDASWKEALGNYFESDQFKKIAERVRTDYLNEKKTVYPQPADLFRAFNETPFENVNVVILGQDPYHNPGQAHGLCFSVPNGVQAPPSLLNIFKEIKDDVGSTNTNTDLTRWATQGVFLLNAVLSVLKNQPTSHGDIGWQQFTDHVITTISHKHEHVVFMLWGAYARSKSDLIDWEKHLILEALHPSPLSAHRGFFGCKHFSQANAYLEEHDKKPIEW
jgi:uracil-DNA glycosylase